MALPTPLRQPVVTKRENLSIGNAERAAEPVSEVRAVAWRQEAGGLGGRDADHREQRLAPQARAQRLHLRHVAGGRGRLPPARRGDGGERAHTHQHLAIAGQHQHPPVGAGERKAEADHCRPAHRAPEIEVERPVAGRRGVVGGGAEPGDHQQIARLAQQRGDHGAAVKRSVVPHCTNTLAPISRWPSSTATGTWLSKASAAAATTVSAASSAWSARRTCTPAAFSTSGVAAPIGTCHGLNSPHSPRMVTRVRNGIRQFTGMDSILIVLPTPEDCMSKAARWPPSQAPAASATPSSSVVSTTACIAGSAWAAAISAAWPASGT